MDKSGQCNQSPADSLSQPCWLPQLLDAVDCGLAVFDLTGNCQFLNATAKRLTSSQHLPLDRLRHEALSRMDDFRRACHSTATSGNVIHLRTGCLPLSMELCDWRSGSDQFELTLIPLQRENGEMAYIGIRIESLNKRSDTFKTLLYQATHDDLTGLVNRRVFMDRLRRLVQHGSTGEHSLFFMDLDRFKLVNDRAGHKAGDEILKQAVRVLAANLRQRDTLARLGGDEFGLLMEHCPQPAALQVAHQLCEAIRQHDFCWQEQHFSLGISIGLTSVSAVYQDVELLIAEADSACYRSKQHGAPCVSRYQRPASNAAASLNRLSQN